MTYALKCETQRESIVYHKILNGVEWVGNKLPDPAVLFFMMCTISRNDSGHFWFNVSVKHPGNGHTFI